MNEGNSVFVTGLVDSENISGAITSLLVLPTVSLPATTVQMASVQGVGIQHDDAPHAVFKLRLLNGSGTVLIERMLVLQELDDHSAEGHSALFNDVFPEPDGQVATIQLLADDTVIDTIAPGVTPPDHQPASSRRAAPRSTNNSRSMDGFRPRPG